MKQITMLVCASLIASATHATNWVEISSSADGGIRQYLDLDSIERNLGLVELRRVVDYAPAQRRNADAGTYASEVVHMEFDCPSRAMRQVALSWHAAQMGEGALVKELKEPSLWEIDSFDELTLPIWKIACAEFEP